MAQTSISIHQPPSDAVRFATCSILRTSSVPGFRLRLRLRVGRGKDYQSRYPGVNIVSGDGDHDTS